MQATLRTYTLLIGRPVYLGEKPTNIEHFIDNKTNNDAYRITGSLNLEFDIKKDNSKEPNKGYVTVYNLSDDTVSYLDANQRESIAIILYAGYNGDEKMIFSGTVEFVEDRWNGSERITKFILGDGTLNLSTAKTARSYRKGTSLDIVLNDLISDLQLPKGAVVPFGSGNTLQYSMAFSGNAAENLNILAKNTGSTFSVQDGAVYWTKEGKRFKQTVFEISEETGMRGSPTPKNPEPAKRRLEKKSKSKSKIKDKPKTSAEIREDAGLTVETLLNGAILPETSVYLKSKKYTGFYKVVYLKHKGQRASGDWVTELGLSETRGELLE